VSSRYVYCDFQSLLSTVWVGILITGKCGFQNGMRTVEPCNIILKSGLYFDAGEWIVNNEQTS
jgi:hypothetical protein